MEDLGHFKVFCYILWTFGIVRGNLVYFSRFGILHQEKNLATLVLLGAHLGMPMKGGNFGGGQNAETSFFPLMYVPMYICEFRKTYHLADKLIKQAFCKEVLRQRSML
jgi:hypothetical protein